MRYILIISLLWVPLFSKNINKILILSDKNIRIPKLKDKNLQNFTFYISSKKIKPFLIAKYELSNREYYEYLSKTKQIEEMKKREKDEPNEPVVNINFYEAEQVCQYLGGRIPSELEWIVAASIKLAPSKCYEFISPYTFVQFPTQKYPLSKNNQQIECMQKEDDEIEANLIGSELLDIQYSYENINGTYGMLGNVWEWVDGNISYFDKKYKIIKGGSYANFEQNILYDNRITNMLNPNINMENIGVRCVWNYKIEESHDKSY